MKNRSIIFILALVFCVGNVCAGATDFQNVYFQDFSAVTDVSENITPQTSKAFSAEVAGQSLDMKTDSLSFFRATDRFTSVGEANGAANSRGISYFSTWLGNIQRLETPETFNGLPVNYKIIEGNLNCLALDEFDGIVGLGTVSLNRGKGYLEKNDIKFNVTGGGFTTDYNTVKLRVKAYASRAGAPLYVNYIRKDNGIEGETTVFTATAEDAGKWVTKEVTLTNIDLTKQISQDNGTQKFTLRFKTAGGYDVFLHSIELLKPDGEVNTSADENVYMAQISEKPLYGDAQLTYDLTLKSNAVCMMDTCSDTCIGEHRYNTGKNRMTVNLLNQHKLPIAQVMYDLDGQNGTISIGYTDAGGSTAFREVYQGVLVGKTYRYKLSYDMQNALNTLTIYEGESLVAETQEPVAMINKDEAESTFAQYYSICHNRTSDAIYSTTDNVGVAFIENAAYKALNEDLVAITLPDVVRDNFEVPIIGAENGSTISWSCSDTSVITVDGANATVNRSVEEDKTVTLTATLTDGLFTVSEEYSVTVKALRGEFITSTGIAEEVNGDIIVATTSVKNAGTTGATAISLVAVSYDANGDIIDRDIDEKSVTSEYVMLDFSVTIQKGDRTEYYLWDENSVPVVNHIPHIYESAFYDKARGAVVEWQKAYDDYGAVESYKIERSDGKVFYTDGELQGDNTLRFYDADATEQTKYTYKLTAMDSNQNEGNLITGDATKLSMPYSINLNGRYTDNITYDGGNHILFIYRKDAARAAHTVPTVYLGENCISVPNGKYIALNLDVGSISKNVAVRFTYATPVQTKFKFMYNLMNADGSTSETSEAVKTYPATDGWQTVDFKLTSEFGYGSTFSNGHFGIGAASSDGVYIKKVELVTLDDYE